MTERPRYYILEGHEARPVDTVEEWARWFEGSLALDGVEARRKDKRRVDFTDLGYCTVSTVFLGVDHAFWGGPPILFETMVFAPPEGGTTFPEEWDGRQRRYTTWDEAVAGHDEMVAELRSQFWKRANGK
jgi:hypothetical protein